MKKKIDKIKTHSVNNDLRKGNFDFSIFSKRVDTT